jgi:Copper amine oxidase N-terminal domain.
VKIRGSAVMTTNAYSDWDGIDNIAKVAIANVVTPAPDAQKATVVFTVDNTKYTVNGVEKTADVAPYIKDGRTFLPVRYVAEALGVSSDNILWDAATKTVTLFKGDRVVKLKIGSKVLYVNGTAINMDVAPEIKNGRTMLPLRWVGTALGVTVEWDEEARTVTVKQ